MSQWKSDVPESVRRLHDRLEKIQLKPVESYAWELRKRHGAEFERQAFISCIDTRPVRRVTRCEDK